MSYANSFFVIGVIFQIIQYLNTPNKEKTLGRVTTLCQLYSKIYLAFKKKTNKTL